MRASRKATCALGVALADRLDGATASLPGLAAVAQEFLQLGQRPGVDYVVGGQPAALRLADAVAQVGQVGGGVRVAVDGELHPGVPRRPDVLSGQVEPVRVGLHLQRGAGPGAGPEQLG